ncbi:MAG TPA: DUF4411 family protein [Solirubrobacteraceae bacterium]|jgi:hypothetical protein|nr:DUF4411 family protein [Solirubrobacteraceae bacterium]
MPYLLDSNIFIQAKNLHYGFDFCPAFWDWTLQQNANGTVFSIQKVRDELIAGADELADWAQARGEEFFLAPDDSVLPSLTTVSAWAGSGIYDPAAASQFLQVADYYLVAQAHAKQLIVVTHETPASSPKRIKIPSACLALGVQALSPYEMLRAEGARFVLGP